MSNRSFEYAKAVAEEIDNEFRYNHSYTDEFIDGALDIEIHSNLHRAYHGAVIDITVGGPYCRLDTRSKLVICDWGTEHGEFPVDDRFCSQLDDILEDLWGAGC